MKFSPIAVMVLLLVGCTSSVSLVKRKHRGGYYFNVSNSKEVQSPSSNLKVCADSVFQEESQLEAKSTVKFDSLPELVVRSEVITQDFQEPVLAAEEKVEQVKSRDSKKEEEITSSNLEKKKTDVDLGYHLLGAITLAGSILYRFKRKIYSVSAWAYRNKKKSRAIIALSQTALIGVSLFTGAISPEIASVGQKIGLLSAIAFAAGVMYPKSKRINSIFKKRASEFVIASAFLGLVHVGVNTIVHEDIVSAQTSSFIQNTKEKVQDSISFSRSDETIDTVIKVVLSALTLAFVASIIVLSMVISCNLACGGAAVAAGAVFIGGVIGSLLLGGWIFMNIWHGPRKKDKEPEKRIWKSLKYSGLLLLIGIAVYVIELILRSPVFG